MKTRIIMYEAESKCGNTKVIYKAGIVKESLIASILSDTYTYGILILSFWINQQYIHSKIVSCILLFSFIFALCFSGKKELVSKEQFKKVMDDYLERF